MKTMYRVKKIPIKEFFRTMFKDSEGNTAVVITKHGEFVGIFLPAKFIDELPEDVRGELMNIVTFAYLGR